MPKGLHVQSTSKAMDNDPHRAVFKGKKKREKGVTSDYAVVFDEGITIHGYKKNKTKIKN